MSQQPDQNPGVEGGTPPRRRRFRRFRRWLIGFGIGLGVLAVLGGTFIGVAEHYTAQPNFCASCHVMEPYYTTWKQDIHGGRLGIACVDCHYAPGERTTLTAKLRGLSQVTSYFSGRYGKTRPRAHVAVESCMTSACHGDGSFMDKPLQVGTVTFRHSKHLKHTAQDEQPARDRLAALTKQLEQQLGRERFAQLNDAARQIGPAEERADAMSRLCQQWNVKVDRQVLAEFFQLEHRTVRISQLHSLQCVDCHANNVQSLAPAITGGQHHFRVQKSSCYTCHFNNQAFNTGTAECMRCHTPPQKTITVHDQLRKDVREKLGRSDLGQKAVRMDHSEIVARKVDCRSCHADVIVGDAVVTSRDCERCHDQPRFFADWRTPLTTDLVVGYHKVHVPQQRAKCLDCHSQIQHQLAPSGEQLAGTGFLSTAMADCTRCHSNQHRDVLKLLVGRGGETVPKSDPNVMFGARTNCYGCHTEREKTEGKDVLVATQRACVTCHDEQYLQTFEQWKQAMETSLSDARQAFQKAHDTLVKATAAPPEARAKAEELLASAKADLSLIRRGNGVHNITYALQLLDGVSARCSDAVKALAAKK
ncbi:MAG: cytochrome c3 family protein [Isosphaerales bacterium]